MAHLRLERPYDAGGILRRLTVEVDGRRVASLRQYQSAELELPPGRHTVVGLMDWTSGTTLEVDLRDDDELRLEIALPLIPMWEAMRYRHRALVARRL